MIKVFSEYTSLKEVVEDLKTEGLIRLTKAGKASFYPTIYAEKYKPMTVEQIKTSILSTLKNFPEYSTSLNDLVRSLRLDNIPFVGGYTFSYGAALHQLAEERLISLNRKPTGKRGRVPTIITLEVWKPEETTSENKEENGPVGGE